MLRRLYKILGWHYHEWVHQVFFRDEGPYSNIVGQRYCLCGKVQVRREHFYAHGYGVGWENAKEDDLFRVLHPQMSERTDGRMVTYERKIRCEFPEPDGSGDFCVNALPPGEECESHWCLRSNYRGQIYGHHWKGKR